MSSQCSAALNPLSRPIRIAYPATAVRGRAGIRTQYLKQHWNKITVAIAAGVLAGFLAGAVSSRQNPALTQVVYAAGAVPETTAVQSAAAAAQSGPAGLTPIAAAREVFQLRAENEHLQALVEQLQKAHATVRPRRARPRHRRRARG